MIREAYMRSSLTFPSNDPRTHWRFDNKGNNLYALVNRYWESAYSGAYGGYMSGGPGESFLMCGAKNGDQNIIWFLDPTSLHISPPNRQDLTLITHDGIILSYGFHWNYTLIYVSNVFGNNDLHYDTV